MQPLIFGLLGISLLLQLSACQSPHGNKSYTYKLVTPDTVLKDIQWSEQEQQENIAARTLSRTQYSSVHLVRLKGKEQPHYHDHHDLYVSLLSGSSTIHFKQQSIEMSAGDVVFIPSGTFHWAENTGNQPSIISTHFSPAFDGKDKRIH